MTAMTDKFIVDIFVPSRSKGLLNDANVLRDAIGKLHTRIIVYPLIATEMSIEVNNARFNFQPMSNVAVFIETLFEHNNLQHYARRILIPNIEWLSESDCNIAEALITDFWHKSKFSLDSLTKMYPKKNHLYLGFTSQKFKANALDYNKFAHFPGKSKYRHSQDIVDIWLKNIHLPPLTYQGYNLGISLPFWINVNKNLRLHLGALGDEQYENEFTKHGVHICTSQMEGFGHYINEARSIGALILALDAPPMNELIDQRSGVLIPVSKKVPHLKGFRYIATPNAIQQRIMEVTEMLPNERAALGANAKDRFEKEQALFLKNLRNIIADFS
jgi:hypothetical protein